MTDPKAKDMTNSQLADLLDTVEKFRDCPPETFCQIALGITEIAARLRATDWQPIESAPKTGELIDVWCVTPDDSDYIPENGGIRLTDISWHDADTILPKSGWIRVMDDGDWDLVEEDSSNALGLPAWKITRWMPKPSPPKT